MQPVIAPLRRPEAVVQSPDTRLHHALADELVALTQILGELAYDLGSNAATLRAHMHSLQAIDRLTQAQIAIADVLRSDLPVEQRIDAITLETLGETLRERMKSTGDVDEAG